MMTNDPGKVTELTRVFYSTLEGDISLNGYWLGSIYAHDPYLIPDLKKAYSQTARGERDKAYFRESLFRGTFISRYFLRAGNARDLEAAKAALRQGLKDTDPAVEREQKGSSQPYQFLSGTGRDPSGSPVHSGMKTPQRRFPCGVLFHYVSKS